MIQPGNTKGRSSVLPVLVFELQRENIVYDFIVLVGFNDITVDHVDALGDLIPQLIHG